MRRFAIGFVLSGLVLAPHLVFAAAPVADPGGPYQGVTGAEVIFNGSVSFDEDEDELEYLWEFGDGESGSGIFPSHIYEQADTYTVTLTVSDGIEDPVSATTEAAIGLRPPAEPVAPEDGADSVEFPLTLEWEEVEGAESYFYQFFPMEEAFLVTQETSGVVPQAMVNALSEKPEPYNTYAQQCESQKGRGCSEEETLGFINQRADVLSPKNYEEYKKQCGSTCSEEDIQRVVVQEQTKRWRVKSCTIAFPLGQDDPTCGPWSDPLWSFVYIPQPPEDLLEPAPKASGITLPVSLEWTPVENIGSYLIDIRLDIGCSIVDNIVGFFIGGDCGPFNYFTEAVFEWFGFGETYDPSCPWNLWNENTKECVPLPILPRLNQEDPPEEELFSQYQDVEQRSILIGEEEEIIEGQCVFSKNAPYKITIASCLDKQAQICGEWSEEWKFTTGNSGEDGSPYILPAPTHVEPEYKAEEPLPVVGKSSSLRWKAQNCVHYVQLFLSPAGASPIVQEKLPNLETVSFSHDKFEELWDEPSDLNKEYAWNLQSCWRVDDEISCESVFSDEWRFMTTGEAPTLQSPESGESIKVPGKLAWQERTGAGSYLVQTARDQDFDDIVKEESVQSTSFTTSLDDFQVNSWYWWRVKTCADNEGDACGENWSEERTFSTYPLLAPTNPGPADGSEFLLPGNLAWDPDNGANYYQYQVLYTSLNYGGDKEGEAFVEDRPACVDKVGNTVVPNPGDASPITSGSSFFFSEFCRGEYEWRVLSCADKNCTVTTPAGATSWTFTAIKQTTQESVGLVPCGKTRDAVSTPFDETEPCELKHAGFLIQNILDFVLWKLSLIVLAVLATMVAAQAYFSFGSPDIGKRMRLIFRSYLYGVLILLFAWAIVNITMAVFGFDVQFFGNWHEIPF